jgi:hypothetical protein
MVRKARQNVGSGLVMIVAVGIIAFLAVGYWLVTRDIEPYRTVPVLDVAAYLENANSLRGNTYRIEGEVLNSLAWSPTSGRLIAIGVSEGRDVLPVLVPTDLNQINIQKGQRFIFLIEVDEKGILKANNLTKA